MKNLLILCLLCLPVLSYANDNKNEVALKLGITPYSTLNYNWKPESAFANPNHTRLGDLGLMLTAEYFRKFNDLFSFGAGLSQQFDRAMSDDDGSLYFTSLYLAAKFNVYKDFYFVGQLGLGFINSNQFLFGDDNIGNKKSGIYSGFGVGYTYKNFIFEFLYSLNKASYEYDIDAVNSLGNPAGNLESEETYQTFNFNIGYKFGF